MRVSWYSTSYKNTFLWITEVSICKCLAFTKVSLMELGKGILSEMVIYQCLCLFAQGNSCTWKERIRCVLDIKLGILLALHCSLWSITGNISLSYVPCVNCWNASLFCNNGKYQCPSFPVLTLMCGFWKVIIKLYLLPSCGFSET